MSVSVVDVNPLASDALIATQVLDAATGQPRPVTAVTADACHAFAHIATGSYLVLSGRPELVLPQLATTAYTFEMTLTFPDCAPLSIELTIPAGTTLPYRPPDILVELPPVTLQGTVSQQAYPNGAIAAATVTVSASAPPPAMLALRTAVSLDHPGAASLNPCTATAAAPATTLIEAAAQASEAVVLASVAGCAPGAALALGSPSDQEHALITAVDAGSGQVKLAAPLQRSRPVGATAQACTIAAAGAGTTLSRDAGAGDGVLELSAALTAELVQIGSPASEVRATNAFSDGAGHWQLDGVRAIGQLMLSASATGYLSSAPLVYDVDYRLPNVIDFSLAV